MQGRDMDDTHKYDEDKPTGTPSWKMSSAWILKRQQRRCGPYSSLFGYGRKVGGWNRV